MPIETVRTGLFEGYTLADLREFTLERLKQPAGKYDRYGSDTITRALNASLLEAVMITKCLHGFAILIMKDGYSQYKPPSDMLLPKTDQIYFYQSSTSYYRIKSRTITWLNEHYPGWRVSDGDPLIMYPGDNYGNLRKLGFYPTPDTDGTTYESGDDTGVYVSESDMTTSGNVTGTNTTAHATVCTDSEGRTLSDEGVAVGMMAVNTTDGSKGQISAVDGSTFTVTLSGGTANTWAVGDGFTVLAGEYGVVVDWENDEHYLLGSDTGGMVDVRTVENNVYMNYYRRPLRLSFDTQKPDIPPEMQIYLPDGAVWQLKRHKPATSTDYQEAIQAYQSFTGGLKQSNLTHENRFSETGLMRCWL